MSLFFTTLLLHIFILDKQIHLESLFLDDSFPVRHGDVHGVGLLGKGDRGIPVEVDVHHACQHIVGEVQVHLLLIASLKLIKNLNGDNGEFGSSTVYHLAVDDHIALPDVFDLLCVHRP